MLLVLSFLIMRIDVTKTAVVMCIQHEYILFIRFDINT